MKQAHSRAGPASHLLARFIGRLDGARERGERAVVPLPVERVEIHDGAAPGRKEGSVNPLEELVEGRKRLEALREPDILSPERGFL